MMMPENNLQNKFIEYNDATELQKYTDIAEIKI